MKKLALMTYLILAIVLGGLVTGCGADFQKGLSAAQTGDFVTALREWEPLAEQGDAYAQYNLGLMYFNGLGVPQDEKTALKWLTLAKRQGVAYSQENLGFLQK